MRRLALILLVALVILIPTLRRADEVKVQKGKVAAYSHSYLEVIKAAAKTYNLPASLIAAVIRAESGFNPNAVSNKGAIGLMQLSLSTSMALNVKDPTDPVENIHAGSKYLRLLIDRFDGNLEKAIAAYNAGPGAVERFNGIPPYRQTQNFVPKVLGYYSKYESGTAID